MLGSITSVNRKLRLTFDILVWIAILQNMEYFDHPVWRCRNCGALFHKPIQGVRGWYHVYCDFCAGDVYRDHSFVHPVRSLRPIPRIKGQAEYSMYRYVCWNCGCSSEFASGYRWAWHKPAGPVPGTIHTCHFCKKENRIV